jgi:hypothetical protein
MTAIRTKWRPHRAEKQDVENGRVGRLDIPLAVGLAPTPELKVWRLAGTG